MSVQNLVIEFSVLYKPDRGKFPSPNHKNPPARKNQLWHKSLHLTVSLPLHPSQFPPQRPGVRKKHWSNFHNLDNVESQSTVAIIKTAKFEIWLRMNLQHKMSLSLTGMTLLAQAYDEDRKRSQAMGIALGGFSLGVLGKPVHLGCDGKGQTKVTHKTVSPNWKTRQSFIWKLMQRS